MRNKALGSFWGKWDLHFHTPSSFDYQNKGISDDQIIKTLVNNEIQAVAITDHHFIDTARIKELKNVAGDKLV